MIRRVGARVRTATQACGAASVAAAALSLAACGAPSPQAPMAQASVISTATTTIAAACGESYRAQAFSPHASLDRFDATASTAARQLAAIGRRHPEWIYQGATVAKIDALSAALLRECGLRRAAEILVHA